MTNYSFSSAFNMTEFFENASFYNMNNTTTWGGAGATLPFYYEASSNTLNFGYGVNLTGNANNPDMYAQINSMLSGLGITLSSAQWTQIASGTDLSSLASTLNGEVTANSANTPMVVQSAADSLASYYYSNDNLSAIQDEIDEYNEANPSQQINWDSLPSGLQAALLDLQYNTIQGSFLGNVETSALLTAIAKNDMEGVAYELAYDTFSYAPSSSNQGRAVADAAQALGFEVQVDGNFNITDLSADNVVGNSVLAQFLQGIATGSSNDYPSSSFASAFVDSLNNYTVSQGFYVPQSGDTWSSIADSYLTGVSSTELMRINAVLPSDYSVGGVVYMPTGSEAVSTTPNNLSGLTPAVPARPTSTMLEMTQPMLWGLAWMAAT